MAGTLAVQSVVMEKGADHIFQEAETIAIELADEATEKLINAFYNSSSLQSSSSQSSSSQSSRFYDTPVIYDTPINQEIELSFWNSSQSEEPVKSLRLDMQSLMEIQQQANSRVQFELSIQDLLFSLMTKTQPDLPNSNGIQEMAHALGLSLSFGDPDSRHEDSRHEDSRHEGRRNEDRRHEGRRNEGPGSLAEETGKRDAVLKSVRSARFRIPGLYVWRDPDFPNLLPRSMAAPEAQSEDSLREKISAAIVLPIEGVDSQTYSGNKARLQEAKVVSTEYPQLSIDLDSYLSRLDLVVEETNKMNLQATVTIFLMGLILAWLLGSHLMKPVSEVVKGMQGVASGDLEVRLPHTQDSEFALINTQFNDMVQQIGRARELEKGLEHRERVQTMGDLAAGVAHDIRNPLSAISLLVGRIRHEFKPEEAAEREEFLNFTKDVKDEIERLNNIVSDFLQLAQPSSQQSEIVNVSDLVEDLLRLLESESLSRNVEIKSAVDSNLSLTRWNKVEAKSALLNVAMNALQAMEANGGKLNIEAKSDSHWIVLKFSDTGPGIKEEDLSQVLLPYVTRRKGGTGLGLSIARRVTERYGGKLTITSERGVGTEVRFHLPVSVEKDA